MEIIVCYKIYFVIEHFQKLLLSLQYVLSCNCFVSNLLWNDLWMQREDVLILWGKIHCCDTNAVDIFILQNLAVLSYLRKVFIKDLTWQKVRPWRALERGAYLNHPIHHLGSVLLCDFTSLDRTWPTVHHVLRWSHASLEWQILRTF